MASDNMEEYNFQIQGVTTERLAAMIKEATNEDIRFHVFKVPNLTGFLAIPFTRKGYKATSSKLGNIYLFDRGTWGDYRKYKESQRLKKKATYQPYGGTESGIAVGEPLLFYAITIVVLVLGYLVGLVVTWVIASIITGGAYKRRKEITYLMIEYDKENEEKVKEALDKIFNSIVTEGGYVKPATKKTFTLKDKVGEFNKEFLEAYTKYFNVGHMTLIAAFSFIGLLTLVKYVGQLFLSTQQMIIVNYLFSIVYLLAAVAILGFILLVYGEVKIRNVYKRVKRNEGLF